MLRRARIASGIFSSLGKTITTNLLIEASCSLCSPTCGLPDGEESRPSMHHRHKPKCDRRITRRKNLPVTSTHSLPAPTRPLGPWFRSNPRPISPISQRSLGLIQLIALVEPALHEEDEDKIGDGHERESAEERAGQRNEPEPVRERRIGKRNRQGAGQEGTRSERGMRRIPQGVSRTDDEDHQG